MIWRLVRSWFRPTAVYREIATDGSNHLAWRELLRKADRPPRRFF
jgi:hypothetical protein